MTTKLRLRESDQTRDTRFQREQRTFVLVFRTLFVATPLLVGGMYLLMRNMPKEAFPPNFWENTLELPLICLSLPFGGYYLVARFGRRVCVLSKHGISLNSPRYRIVPWRQLDEWRIEDSREFPRHFILEFRARNTRNVIAITLPDTYSRQDIRDLILHSLAQAF